MPESYADAWRRLDEGYDRHTREATDLQIEGTLQAHAWDGGFRCGCGTPVDLPRDWGWHLLEIALTTPRGIPDTRHRARHRAAT